MSDRFTLAHYQGQYIDAAVALSRAADKLDNLKGSAAYYRDFEEFQEKLAAAEAEYQAAKEKADNLWYLANTGKPKPEGGSVGAAGGGNVFLSTGGNNYTRWPDPPKGRTL